MNQASPIKTFLRGFMSSVCRHFGRQKRSRRDRVVCSAAHQIESCEPRQLLSATGDSSAASAFCDPVSIISSVADTEDRTPVFEWDAVAGASEYEVFVAARGRKDAVFRTRGITGTSFEVSRPLGFGEFTVWVRAYGADTETPWGTGQNLRITARVEMTVDENELSWPQVNDATGYRIWMDELNDDGSVRVRQTLLFTTLENKTTLGAHGKFRAWVQPIRLDLQSTHFGYWSPPIEFELSGAPDISQFDFQFDTHEYLIEQGEVRDAVVGPGIVNLYYADGAIVDADEYLLRIHATSTFDAAKVDGSLRYVDAQKLSDFLAVADVVAPPYLFEFEIAGSNGIKTVVQSTTPIADLSLEDVASLGTGPLSVRIRVRNYEFGSVEEEGWSAWSDAYQFSIDNAAPALQLLNNGSDPAITFPPRANVSSFSEAALAWEGWYGTPMLQTDETSYLMEVTGSNTPGFTQFLVRTNIKLRNHGLQPGDYEVRVRSVVGTETSEWSERVSFTADPLPTRYSLPNFSPIDRTPEIQWELRPGTSSYRIVVEDESGNQVYAASLPGTPRFTPVNDVNGIGTSADQLIAVGHHEVTEQLPDGNYTVRVDMVYENGVASLPTTPLDFTIGARPEFIDPENGTAGEGGAISWTAIDGATEYQIWMNEINESGDTLVNRVLLETVTRPQFEIPTTLAAGTYRMWFRAIMRETDGQMHRSNWSVPKTVQLEAAPATVNVENWVAAEYHVTQSVYAGNYSERDGLPEYVLRIGTDRPVEYRRILTNRPPFHITTLGLGKSVYEFELTNVETDTSLNRTVTQTGRTGDDVLIDLTTEDVAALGSGEIVVRVRQRFSRDFYLADSFMTPPSRFSNWSEEYRFAIGTISPGRLRTHYIPGVEPPTLVWTHARTVRRFDESEIEYSGSISNISIGTPVVDETPARYEIWISHVQTGERVIYEKDLTEVTFTMPVDSESGTYRAWFRAIVDGTRTSQWSRSIEFEHFHATALTTT